jgi:peptidoglycan/LPS O-acetylase OafA/YrhL
MTSTPDKQTATAAYLGCAAAAGYAVIKVAWGLGSTFGIRDTAAFEEFIDQIGGPQLALWGTVLPALLAGAILLSLVQPWGRRVPRRLRAASAWLGFAIMAPVGVLRLGATLAATIAGEPFPVLAPAIYIWVYACFSVLGLTFAFTAWRTRDHETAHRSVLQGAAS